MAKQTSGREAARQQRLLEDLARSTRLLTEPAELQSAICARIREIAGCEGVVFLEYQAPREAFVSSQATELAAPAPEPFVLRANGRLAKWLRVNEEPLPVPDARGVFDYLESDERDLLKLLGVRMCLPLVAVNRLIGVLLLVDAHARWSPNGEDLAFLAACGRQAALACESANLQRAERERIRSAGRAQQLAVAGQLAAAVAHEVRNPLHTIRSTVQYVLDRGEALRRRNELLQTVIEEVDRIEHTIAGVLSLSRPHALEVSEIDLVDVAERSMRVVEAYAESARVTVEASFGCRPLPILGDPNELGQVFVNVMLNACQAMPEGGRVQLVSTLSHDVPLGASGGTLGVIEVRDEGPGIDDDQVSRVFDPFFTTKPGGTGLGLPICLDIMTRHAGQIRLDSQPGQGTTVSIAVPLRSASWHES